jgi:hypothetical protein
MLNRNYKHAQKYYIHSDKQKLIERRYKNKYILYIHIKKIENEPSDQHHATTTITTKSPTITTPERSNKDTNTRPTTCFVYKDKLQLLLLLCYYSVPFDRSHTVILTDALIVMQ